MKTILIVAEDSNGPVRLAQFANEGTEVLVAFSNDISFADDGWAQIAPFGDFPGMALIADGKGGFRKEPAIQRMDKAAVTQMVNEYHSTRRGVRKFLKSRPLFVGHPDVPGPTGAKYPDKSPKGVFADIAQREDGFYGEPILTDEGERLIATKAFRALSGRWDAEPTGESENGIKIYRPTRFISAGLTNQPNLPVQLLNEADPENQQTQTKIMKREIVIALLAGLGVSGITLANDASDEQISESIKKLGEKAKTADTLATEKTTIANEKATLATDKASLEGKVQTLTGEKATLTTERDTARTNFANERKARSGELLDQAIKAGQITQADRATWETKLGNETTFANEAEALKALKPTVKVTSVTLQRGDRKVEISNASQRREMVADLVNEEMTASKCDYDRAFSKVQRNYPQLFQAMDAPELRKGGPKKAA